MATDDRESRIYSEPFRIANSRGSSPPHPDKRENLTSIIPIAGLMMGAAYSDNHFCNRELNTVRRLLCRLLERDTLPGVLEEYINRFNPQSFDLKASVEAYAARSNTTRRRLLELIREVCDADSSYVLEEERYMLELIAFLTIEPENYQDLVVEESRGINGALKRALDVLLGGVGLLIAGPIMIVVALAVKFTSKGPVLFKQKRFGRNGKEIGVYKFRSIRTTDNGPVVQQATKGDSRITPVGAFLRRTSLDELPQLFNVVRGDMSLVGPRPHAVAHNREFGTRIIEYSLRHKIKPGITGWAQVNGWRGETDTLRKMVYRVEHDLYYIRNWSIWLDIKIIFLTVFGRKVRHNAY
jgi:putative colanic acid biosynthesis UDP-glucose lipid carrier transferase